MSNESFKSNVDDYELYWLGETDKAVKVKDELANEPFWLPKSQIEFERHEGTVLVTMPEWLATKHGLC